MKIDVAVKTGKVDTKWASLQTPPGWYRLECWNGVEWEVGHPNHWLVSEGEWKAIKSQVRQWSHPWRLLEVKVREQSK